MTLGEIGKSWDKGMVRNHKFKPDFRLILFWHLTIYLVKGQLQNLRARVKKYQAIVASHEIARPQQETYLKI